MGIGTWLVFISVNEFWLSLRMKSSFQVVVIFRIINWVPLGIIIEMHRFVIVMVIISYFILTRLSLYNYRVILRL